ncbi:MAG: hypothetical protein ACKOD2_17675 [Ilumatobacteraceae bacterium]
MSTSDTRVMTMRRVWIALAVGYGALRVALAGAFLTEYGLDLIVFALIELGSSLLFGICSGRLVESMVRRTGGRRTLLVTGVVVGYGAPDVYVLAFAGRFPTSLLVVVIAVIVVSSIVSVVSFRRRARSTESAP